MPVRTANQADLSARADRFDGEAGARRLGPPNARAIAVHHELGVEWPTSRVKPADRVGSPNEAAVSACDAQGQVLPRVMIGGPERRAGDLDSAPRRLCVP